MLRLLLLYFGLNWIFPVRINCQLSAGDSLLIVDMLDHEMVETNSIKSIPKRVYRKLGIYPRYQSSIDYPTSVRHDIVRLSSFQLMNLFFNSWESENEREGCFFICRGYGMSAIVLYSKSRNVIVSVYLKSLLFRHITMHELLKAVNSNDIAYIFKKPWKSRGAI